MAEIHRLRPQRPRRSGLSCDALAWIMLALGGLAAFASLFVAGLGGLSTLLGLAVALGGYVALYDRCRG